MTTNPFTDRYKSYTTVQLLAILDSKQDYQPLAVETAQSELDSRKLTAQQLAEARQTIESQRQENSKQQEKVKAIENKIKSAGSSMLDYLSPTRTTEHTPDKFIKGICILFGLQFLYALYSQFSMIKFMFTDSESKWDFSMLLYFLPLVLIPTATVLFWLKKKLGWTLLSIFLTFSALTALYSVIVNVILHPTHSSVLDNLFPQPSATIELSLIIFFGGLLAYICRQSIRDIYTVDRQHMFLTIGIIAALTTYQWWGLLTR